MFIPTEDEELVNIRAIESASVAEEFRVKATTASGREYYLEGNMEIIEAMGCPVVPANEAGFFSLVFNFADNALAVHPVIAWRIRTPHAPEPICPHHDMIADAPAFFGVQYPDGRVILGNGTIFDDRTKFLTQAKAERLEFLRGQRNGD